MEPTNPTPQPMQSQNAQVPVDPQQAISSQPLTNPISTPESTMITDQKSSGGSKKMMLIGLLIVVLILLIGGGAYWFMSSTPQTTSKDSSQEVAQQTSEALDTLKQELESLSIDESDIQQDLTELDNDLANL